MSQSIIASDLIRRSMYLIGALAAGENMGSVMANDALATLNEMIDSWSNETLAVYGTSNDEFPLIPGQAAYTYGIGGDFNVPRPVYVDDMYMIRQGVTTPVEIIPIERYNAIAIKSQSQPLVEKAYITNSFPLSIVSVWPIPSEANTLGFTSNRVLTLVTSLSDMISLPPGYLRALRYCLAVDLWPEYPNTTTDINTVKAIALKAKANIKTANMNDIEATFEDIPRVESGRSWDWRGG
jgi:hypothetical protein